MERFDLDCQPWVYKIGAHTAFYASREYMSALCPQFLFIDVFAYKHVRHGSCRLQQPVPLAQFLLLQVASRYIVKANDALLLGDHI